jgi:hypothetical protein
MRRKRESENPELQISGHQLGSRPDGPVSVLYDLAPHPVDDRIVHAVRVDTLRAPVRGQRYPSPRVPDRDGPLHSSHRHVGASEAASLSWQTVLQLQVWLGNWVDRDVE